jgi:hypothetical protein
VGCLGGNQDIGQLKGVEQRGERGDLAGLGLDLDLPEDDTADRDFAAALGSGRVRRIIGRATYRWVSARRRRLRRVVGHDVCGSVWVTVWVINGGVW